MKLKELIKTHQQSLALSVGYILVFILAFGLGRITAFKYNVPEIRIEESFNLPESLPVNNTANAGVVQSANVDNSAQKPIDCAGKIKGSSSMIYHLPDGAFYSRTTNPIKCFDTEAEATAAGFRKSSR